MIGNNLRNNPLVNSSWKSILFVTLPIVLTSLSHAIMCNIDRVMIIGYSVNSLNAVSISGNFFITFSSLFIGIADTAEVFVGQYNGAKNYKKLASPMWQMIYFSLLTAFISFPVAYFSDYLNLLPPHCLDEGIIYQKIMMYGCPVFPMFAAFASYFVGQGRALIVTISVICGSCFNIVADYILIYGIEGIIPSSGAAGAALATIMSVIMQILILIAALSSKKDREIAFSARKFDKKSFLGCLKVGAPISLSNFLVYFAWYIIQALVSNSSKEEATIYSISTCIYILAISSGEGLSKGASTVIANMIGRDSLIEAKEALKKLIYLAVLMSALFIIPLSIFPDQCVFSVLELLKEDISSIYHYLKITLYWISFTVILESILCVIWGVLVAGGDTVYPTIVYQSCIWGFVVLPLAVAYYYMQGVSTIFVYELTVFWLCSSLYLFYKRYASMKWYHKLI